MELTSLIGHISEIFRIISKNNQPPDKLTGEYLRSKKYLGSNDRRFISENLYNILRIKSFPEMIYNDKLSALSKEVPQIHDHKHFLICIAGIMSCQKLGINSDLINWKYSESGITLEENLIKAVDVRTSIGLDLSEEIISIILSQIDFFKQLNHHELIESGHIGESSLFFGQQDWVIRNLIKSGKYRTSELIDLLNSLLLPAPLTLRINAEVSKREAIITKLKEFDPNCENTTLSTFGIKLSKRIDLNTVPMYKSGVIEVQDEGSQLISIALGAEKGETILDACAGAGGKSLHIAALTNNQSYITASDIEMKKLKELYSRAKKAGYTSITTIGNKELLKSKKQFDKILIDAPCSGMGTVRRNPMLKWKLTPESLEQYSSKQKIILAQYSKFLKPGGSLVYSTCSLMMEENEDVINNFLVNNPNFEPEPVLPYFQTYGIELKGLMPDDYDYQTLPSIHGCDGFYLARIRKIE